MNPEDKSAVVTLSAESLEALAAQIEQRIQGRPLYLAPDAVDQICDRLMARIRAGQLIEKPLTCRQVGELIGRSTQFVQDECRTRKVRSLSGKPYLILPSEVRRWMESS